MNIHLHPNQYRFSAMIESVWGQRTGFFSDAFVLWMCGSDIDLDLDIDLDFSA